MASLSFNPTMEQTFSNTNNIDGTIQEQNVQAGTSQSRTESPLSNASETVEQDRASDGLMSLNLEEIKEKLASKEFITQKRAGSRYTSSNWNTFHEIVTKDGLLVPNYVVCTNCNKLQGYDPIKGTNNLNRHVQACTMPKNSILRYLAKKSVSLDRADKNSLLNAAKRFCYLDLRPFKAVEGEGLIDLLHAVSSITARHGLLSKEQLNEIIPAPITVQRNISENVKVLREQLTTQLHKALDETSLSCTLDVWTDKIRHLSYLGVVGHFISINEDNTISLQRKMLGLRAFDANDRKDGKAIREMLWSVLKDYKLYKRRAEITYITDRGSPMIKGLRNYKRNNCLAHLINNIAAASLRPVIKTIKKVSKIVKYLKVTGLNTLLDITLKSYVPTRWNSVFEMLESFLISWTKIEQILSTKNNDFIVKFRSLSRSKLEAMKNYFEMYKRLTNEIEGDLVITNTRICPIVECLVKYNQIEDDDIPIVKLMKAASSKYFQENQDAIANDYELYAFLNPLHKKFTGIAHIDKEKAFENIKQKLLEFEPTIDEVELGRLNRSQGAGNSSSILDMFNDSNAIQDTNSSQELERYINYNVIGQNLALLEWWEKHRLEFPCLYKLFITISGIPASSASCERLFSYAGNFLTVKRNRLRSDTLEDLLFMYMNDKF